jgi:three-Cys-motif partner protein
MAQPLPENVGACLALCNLLLLELSRTAAVGSGKVVMAHRYGGPWTEIKLDAVQYYLECYAKALTAAKMDTWYIDAFAGTGDREADREVGGIFDGGIIDTVTETLDGSARRALKVMPPIQHFVFIEQDPERCKALEALKSEADGRDVTVLRGDANAAIGQLVQNPPWSLRNGTRNRGVVFLDPYALHVDWATLRALAATHVLDVWYLFPIRDVVSPTLTPLFRNWSKGVNARPCIESCLEGTLFPASAQRPNKYWRGPFFRYC